MSLLFIPDMNYDVQSIILDYKQQLDDYDKHKLKMKTIFAQMKTKLKCVHCEHLRQFHVFNVNNVNKYVRSPVCNCCMINLRCIDILFLLDLLDEI